MANTKYIYDPNTLSYIPVNKSLKDKFKSFVPYLVAGVLLGVTSFAVVALNFKTPTEKIQAKENSDMQKHLKILDGKLAEANKTLDDLITLDDSLYRTLLGDKPMLASLRKAGTGGTDKYTELKSSTGTSEILDTYQKLDELFAKMNVQEGSYKELFKKTVVNFDRMQHLPAIIPIANWDLKYIGSGFAPQRLHPILGKVRPHEGIDFVAPTGTSVYASAEGKVSSVRNSSSFGKVIEVDHGYGIITLYAHLSKFKVKRGQKVKRGEIIGLVGNTGLSAGPHLHYEVHVNNVEVNPVNYFFNDLSPNEYKEVVAKAESITTCME
ncbi:M23 family metallopeptidase [Labilibacter sediminis]|nr:M23 family metallopeptidase [Labilibacter sediminis]